jgi:outer membrane protein OmpA-like peptidoglycan-associated protein
MITRRKWLTAPVGAVAMATLALAASGCATKGFVQSEVAQSKAYTDTKFNAMEGEVDRAQTRADEAYEKATLAERLANGHLEYEEVSSHRVQFAFDDYTLNSDAQMVLDDLGSRLSSHPRYVLESRGFADATGSDRYNYRLGRERAESVQRYMMTRYAVPASRVAIISFGEESPLAENDSSSGREQNRRVQVRLLDAHRDQGDPVANQAQ